ncbi:hypothetical protein ASPZODRAFT_55391 [Penicilliopsis zonata CBS 506.65]|uniref:FAD-binding domain-containing protein n=1 Tax=Penicilliopsis zonata CBS 506.65 TaxID=1073090 RepID=A0A1L9SVI1_9EURO|nr:hypothetical protein ASPZODRAFT_55391 [Penicilliopsis zonata CBS 506.65]OJJ51156.1 hypothetical protein ASPZODRAFT_55391 [Penicilliopsis zonata CBS 506.65]
MPAKLDRVLIVGAGPVGLFLALNLGQAGIQVHVIERDDQINPLPRAVGYFGAALQAFAKANLLNLLSEEGYWGPGLAWRKPPVDDEQGGKAYGELSFLMLPQSEACEIFLRAALRTGNVSVSYNKEIHGICDTGDAVTATLRDTISGLLEETTVSFLVGADGGKSMTRKLLDISFHGHTWPERMVSMEFEAVNWCVPNLPINLIVDPINFGAIIPITRPVEGQASVWRYTIAVQAEDPRLDEELLSEANVTALIEKFMPGPPPAKYKLIRKAVYRIHQRVASAFRRGRCAVAGDAAHLCNPIGGMGLNTGLLDAEALADTLTLIINHGLPESLLDVYADERRRVFQLFVDPVTTANKYRLMGNTEDDWFFRMVKTSSPEMQRYGRQFLDIWPTDMHKIAQEQGLMK